MSCKETKMAQPELNKNLPLLDLHCNEDFSILETHPTHQSTTNTHPATKLKLQHQFDQHHHHQEQEQENELHFLLSKQEETYSVSRLCFSYLKDNNTGSLSAARREAVEWILGVTSYHSFSAVTAFLSVNYLDQFLLGFQLQRKLDPVKPWMVQLAAVACLSLAAKLEETHVPLLLDLQEDGRSEYAFEPSSVQKMELLVLLMLDWKMNPVTPFSFLNDITGRILVCSESCREMEFVELFGMCIVSHVVTDPRFVMYRPSVIAAAVAVRVMKTMRVDCTDDDDDYCKNELHKYLKFSTEEFEECYQLIVTLVSTSGY